MRDHHLLYWRQYWEIWRLEKHGQEIQQWMQMQSVSMAKASGRNALR